VLEPEETTKGKYAYKFTLAIGGCIGKQSMAFHINDAGLSEDDWDNLSEEARHEVLDEHLQEWKIGLVDCGWAAA